MNMGVASSLFLDISGMALPTAALAENGLYVSDVVSTRLVAPPRMTFSVRKLGSASALVLGDTGTARFYLGSVLGKSLNSTYKSSIGPSGPALFTQTASLSLALQTEANAVGLHIAGPSQAIRGPLARAMRVTSANETIFGIGIRHQAEMFSIDLDGEVKTRREYLYLSPKSRDKVIPFAEGLSQISGNWTLASIGFLATDWRTGVPSTNLLFPLNLPDGAEITKIDVLLKQGVGAGAKMVVALALTSGINFPGVVAGTPSTVAFALAVAGAALQRVVLPALTSVVTNATESWTVGIISSSDAAPLTPDQVFGVQVTFLDPGPRNF
jgi:hypothetical protein